MSAMRQIRHLLLIACLVLGSVAVTVAAFEVAFLGHKERYSAWEDHGLFRLHKQKIYAMAPDYTGIWETAEFSVTLSSNGDGCEARSFGRGLLPGLECWYSEIRLHMGMEPPTTKAIHL